MTYLPLGPRFTFPLAFEVEITMQKPQASDNCGPTEKHTDDDKIWWIPVSYATKLQADFDDTKPKFWIEGQKETKVELDIQEGYLLNLKHSG